MAGDWKLAMTPENIALLENAREVHAPLCHCVKELGGLRERGGGFFGFFWCAFLFVSLLVGPSWRLRQNL